VRRRFIVGKGVKQAPGRDSTRQQETMRTTRSAIIAVIVAGVAVGLAGCREEEQDRPLHLEKGTYSGKADTELTAEQRRALEQRGQLQKF
jgi:hypothetical protein